ncbi:unnamed protein product, partial [Prorocentrum cordatum]
MRPVQTLECSVFAVLTWLDESLGVGFAATATYKGPEMGHARADDGESSNEEGSGEDGGQADEDGPPGCAAEGQVMPLASPEPNAQFAKPVEAATPALEAPPATDPPPAMSDLGGRPRSPSILAGASEKGSAPVLDQIQDCFDC